MQILRRQKHPMSILLMGFVVLLCMSARPVVAQEEAQFGADNPRGLIIKTVVRPESSILTLVPVNLDEGIIGEPFELRGRGDVRIAASRGPGESRLVSYAGYYLEPGDYAVLMMRADVSQAFWDITNTFCLTRFAAVLSVRAGEAAFWVPVPVSIATWPEYQTVVTNESFSAGLERFQRSMANSQNVRPAAIRTMPTAFLNLAGDLPVNVRDCVARSFSIAYRVED